MSGAPGVLAQLNEASSAEDSSRCSASTMTQNTSAWCGCIFSGAWGNIS